MSTDFHISTEEEIRVLTDKLEVQLLKLRLLENDVRSMKSENTEKENERKENIEILKTLKNTMEGYISEFKANLEEMQCRENEVTSYDKQMKCYHKDH